MYLLPFIESTETKLISDVLISDDSTLYGVSESSDVLFNL